MEAGDELACFHQHGYARLDGGYHQQCRLYSDDHMQSSLTVRLAPHTDADADEDDCSTGAATNRNMAQTLFSKSGMSDLTPRQKRFAQAIAAGKNGPQASREAGLPPIPMRLGSTQAVDKQKN